MRALTWLCWSMMAWAAEPSAELSQARQLLATRHHPGCEAVVDALRDAGGAAGVDAALRHLAESHHPIPWVQVRAAACLTPRSGVEEAFAVWVEREDLRGLASVVLDRLHLLPEDRALRLAQRALTSPLARDHAARLRHSRVEAVRALAP